MGCFYSTNHSNKELNVDGQNEAINNEYILKITAENGDTNFNLESVNYNHNSELMRNGNVILNIIK